MPGPRSLLGGMSRGGYDLGVERVGAHHTCGWQTGGTHLTGMLSCVKNVHVSDH